MLCTGRKASKHRSQKAALAGVFKELEQPVWTSWGEGCEVPGAGQRHVCGHREGG